MVFVQALRSKNKLKNRTSSHNNIIIEYVEAMQTETNPSKSYKATTSKILAILSRFHNHKPFNEMTREDIIIYLNSLRKDEVHDPLNKWIGTYNLYLVCITKFFKWIYNPTQAGLVLVLPVLLPLVLTSTLCLVSHLNIVVMLVV